MIENNSVNLPHIVVEVKAAFDAYEAALMNNDLAMLDHWFWHSASTVRFGAGETLYGIDAIRRFRETRSTAHLTRSLMNTTITTFSADFAVTTTEFERINGASGRQTQCWVRFIEGWRIVSAHISLSA